MSSDGGDPQFVLTLSHLQRLYAQTRGVLLAAAESSAADIASAREAVQDAFAATAKNRFSFRSERAAVAWLEHCVAEAVLRGTAPNPDALYDWADVLRRANIRPAC